MKSTLVKNEFNLTCEVQGNGNRALQNSHKQGHYTSLRVLL